MGRSSVSGLTLARCQRLSSSTRCLMATWAPTCRCCILQPPQAPACRPKFGQPGRTRWEDSRWMAVRLAASQLFFLRWVLALTSSVGRAPSMNTTLPSLLRATPWASISMDNTCSQPSGSAGASMSASGRLSGILLSRGSLMGHDCLRLSPCPVGGSPKKPPTRFCLSGPRSAAAAQVPLPLLARPGQLLAFGQQVDFGDAVEFVQREHHGGTALDLVHGLVQRQGQVHRRAGAAGEQLPLLRRIVRERKPRDFDPTSEMLRELIAEPGFDAESPDAQDRVHETLRLMESLGIWTDEMLRLSPSTLDKLLRLGASVQRFVRSEAADTRVKRGRRA